MGGEDLKGGIQKEGVCPPLRGGGGNRLRDFQKKDDTSKKAHPRAVRKKGTKQRNLTSLEKKRHAIYPCPGERKKGV